MFSFFKKEALIVSGLFFCFNVFADTDHHGVGAELNSDGLKSIRSDSHAPIGVMAEHMHNKGEWMVSYRYQYMNMQGNRIGTSSVSPEFIATTIRNPNGPPPTLRVVPTKMTMEMHMVGGMYAPTDWLTLMFMTMYSHKSMDNITFQGGAGTAVLGSFNTKSSGLGDTKISGMVRLLNNGKHKVHLNAGVSLPTGDTDEADDVFTPMGARPTLRLPYAMQLGSGTYDLLPGITYSGTSDRFNWGAQYMGTIRTGSNNGYRFGNKQELSSWLSYQWQPWVSTSTRIAYSHEEQIKGSDTLIAAPVQTADPENYGGDIVNLFFGLNLAGQTGRLRGHRLAAEVGIPLHRDLNGPQLETDLIITGSWQFAF